MANYLRINDLPGVTIDAVTGIISIDTSELVSRENPPAWDAIDPLSLGENPYWEPLFVLLTLHTQQYLNLNTDSSLSFQPPQASGIGGRQMWSKQIAVVQSQGKNQNMIADSTMMTVLRPLSAQPDPDELI
jgi:hypothetical protein